jgi:hypothetical protein
MSLSIIPLTPPLYNVYRAYADMFSRYKDAVFVNSLVGKNTSGAPASTVRALADIYCDSLLTIYNLRIAIDQKRKSEVRIALFYAWIAILLLTLVVGGFMYILWKRFLDFKKMQLNDPGNTVLQKEGERKFYFLLLYMVALLIAYSLIMTIIIITYVRKRDVTNKLNNVDFAGNGSVFSQQITSIFPPEFLTAKPTISKFLKYRVTAGEGRMYRSLSSMCVKAGMLTIKTRKPSLLYQTTPSTSKFDFGNSGCVDLSAFATWRKHRDW